MAWKFSSNLLLWTKLIFTSWTFHFWLWWMLEHTNFSSGQTIRCWRSISVHFTFKQHLKIAPSPVVQERFINHQIDLASNPNEQKNPPKQNTIDSIKIYEHAKLSRARPSRLLFANPLEASTWFWSWMDPTHSLFLRIAHCSTSFCK